MKKILSVLAMAAMIVGLVGCMDNPDAGNKKPGASSASSIRL